MSCCGKRGKYGERDWHGERDRGSDNLKTHGLKGDELVASHLRNATRLRMSCRHRVQS